jgi:phosphoglycolate phosphatase
LRYELAVFEFDGTLADTFAWFCSLIPQMTERFRLAKVEPSELAELRHLDAKRILARLGVPFWKIPALARFMRSRMGEDLGRLSLFDGAAAMLRSLAGHGVAIAIVSSNAEDNVRAMLGPDTASLVGRFECGASLYGKPRKVRRVLSFRGAARENTILIGDEIRDARAARQIGIAFGAVCWGYNTRAALETCSPDVVFETMEDITAKLV